MGYIKIVEEELIRQENYLLYLRESKQKKQIHLETDNCYKAEKNKMIGMLRIAQSLGVEIKEYSWVYL